VEPWYAQNTLVYTADADLLAAGPRVGERMPARVIHPRLFYDRSVRVLDRHELAWQVKRTLRKELSV
jgi:hypothetical protein